MNFPVEFSFGSCLQLLLTSFPTYQYSTKTPTTNITTAANLNENDDRIDENVRKRYNDMKCTSLFDLCRNVRDSMVKQTLSQTSQLKTKWKTTKTLPIDNMFDIAMNNTVYTDMCTWKITKPSESLFLTRTLNDELSVLVWTCACKYANEAWFGRNADKSSNFVEDVQHMTTAASIFVHLCKTAHREDSASYNPNNPLFQKAFVCKAYEALCLGLCNVLIANVRISTQTNKIDTITMLYLDRALFFINSGYDIFKNEEGSDSDNIYLLKSYNFVAQILENYYCYYEALYYIADPLHRKTCIDRLKRIIDVAKITTPQTAEKMSALLQTHIDLHVLDESKKPLSITDTVSCMIPSKNTLIEAVVVFTSQKIYTEEPLEETVWKKIRLRNMEKNLPKIKYEDVADIAIRFKSKTTEELFGK